MFCSIRSHPRYVLPIDFYFISPKGGRWWGSRLSTLTSKQSHLVIQVLLTGASHNTSGHKLLETHLHQKEPQLLLALHTRGASTTQIDGSPTTPLLYSIRIAEPPQKALVLDETIPFLQLHGAPPKRWWNKALSMWALWPRSPAMSANIISSSTSCSLSGWLPQQTTKQMPPKRYLLQLIQSPLVVILWWWDLYSTTTTPIQVTFLCCQKPGFFWSSAKNGWTS